MIVYSPDGIMPLSVRDTNWNLPKYLRGLSVYCVQPSRSRWQLIFFITASLHASGNMAYVILGTSREQQWTTDDDVNAPSVSADTNENAPLVSDSVSNSRTCGIAVQ